MLLVLKGRSWSSFLGPSFDPYIGTDRTGVPLPASVIRVHSSHKEGEARRHDSHGTGLQFRPEYNDLLRFFTRTGADKSSACEQVVEFLKKFPLFPFYDLVESVLKRLAVANAEHIVAGVNVSGIAPAGPRGFPARSGRAMCVLRV